jgi:hypothetical protein
VKLCLDAARAHSNKGKSNTIPSHDRVSSTYMQAEYESQDTIALCSTAIAGLLSCRGNYYPSRITGKSKVIAHVINIILIKTERN